jgi:hypothetical protein
MILHRAPKKNNNKKTMQYQSDKKINRDYQRRALPDLKNKLQRYIFINTFKVKKSYI